MKRERRRTVGEISARAFIKPPVSVRSARIEGAHRARSPSFGSSLQSYKDKGLIGGGAGGSGGLAGVGTTESEPNLEDNNLKPIVFGACYSQTS